MYTTHDKVEKFLNTTITTDMTDWIAWVQDYIDTYTGTTFEPVSGIRYFDGDGEVSLFIDDFTSITALEFMDIENDAVEDTLITNDYFLYPLNTSNHNEIRLNTIGGRYEYFPMGPRRIKVTGTFGVANIVPPSIEWVATSMVSDIYQSQSGANKTITGETLGEYSVTYMKVATKDIYQEILNLYRTPLV